MALIGGMVIVSLQIGTSSRAIDPAPHMAMPAHPTQPSSQFQTIEQPFWVKAIVTVGGLSLIGLELWWFLYKPSTTKNTP
jgi:plastocyanin domain-containing protein